MQTFRHLVLGLQASGKTTFTSSREAIAIISEEAVRSRILSVRPKEVTRLMVVYGELSSELSGMAQVIESSLAVVATRNAILDAAVPSWLRTKIILMRPDLIDATSVAYVKIEDALPLLELLPLSDIRPDLLLHWMQADPGTAGSELLARYPETSLSAAVLAAKSNLLHRNWQALIAERSHIFALLDLTRMKRTSDLALTFRLLRYPLRGDVRAQASKLNSALACDEDDVRDGLRIEFLSYLVVVSLLASNEASLSLLGFALPDLRRSVRANKLPVDARHLLQDNLPTLDYSNWDLDKRLLLGLRKLIDVIGVTSNLAERLGLSESDIATVMGAGAPESPYSPWEIFRPWRW